LTLDTSSSIYVVIPNDIPMVKLKAVILLGTLKTSAETSNTHILSEFLANHLKSFDTESEIIRLADYTVRPGVYTNVGPDDWPAIFEMIWMLI
jgi:hypothetical protein